MTTGQLVFYSGILLLCLTLIIAIIFILKKPNYTPENAGYRTAKTSQIPNSYPTERQTIRRGEQIKSSPPTQLEETEKMENETAAIFQGGETEILPPTE